MTLLLLFYSLCVTAPDQESGPPADREAIQADVKAFAEASGAPERGAPERSEERVRIERRLLKAGEPALPIVRKARDAAAAGPARDALQQLACQLLAGKLSPVLRERMSTGLYFDGQYADLRSEVSSGAAAPADAGGKAEEKDAGSETIEALFFLFNDEAAPSILRLGAARALADLGDAALLPRLRKLEADMLLHAALREEAGTLLAIHGDTRHVDQKIRDLLKDQDSKDPRIFIETNLELANLYYKIRKYGRTTDCYERVIKIFKELRGNSPNPIAIDQRLALHYYNAACSYSLQGKLEKSRAALKSAVELDPMHYSNMEKDGDFRKLRESPGFAEFKKELGKLLEKDSI